MTPEEKAKEILVCCVATGRLDRVKNMALMICNEVISFLCEPRSTLPAQETQDAVEY